jgi:aminoglycoside phosphotransferase family enzyme/predicted kinase
MSEDADGFVRGMLDPAAYPHPVDPIRLIETHVSWVFLTGSFVYKVKKPRVLGFLDSGTLERRRCSCHEEVRVSRRFAPTLYVGVVPITGSRVVPLVDGPGSPCEWAVKLVQFDEANRLDALLDRGLLTAAACAGLGDAIARLHERLAIAVPDAPWGSAASLVDAAGRAISQIRTLRPDVASRVESLGGWFRRRVDTLLPTLGRRKAWGRVRECHGDLHLANIVRHEGSMTPFDAIEFNESLRWIDVANDLAFLTMDLASRGRGDLAAHVASAWIEAADDHDAAVVLPVYEVYRALVRADVAAIRGRQESGEAAEAARLETDRYLDLAGRLARPRRPVLFATSGVSGSGKSTLALALVGACGAARIRSDVERKRLVGMQATGRPTDAESSHALYGTAMTRLVYERVATLARTVLGGGRSVVLDAACTLRWQRDWIGRTARAAGVPLVWLDFELPAGELLARVASRAARGHDPSDASAAVVRAQLAAREPLTVHEAAAAGATLVRVTPRALGDSGFVARLAALAERETAG